MPSSQGELTVQLETRTLLAAVDVHAVAVGVDLEVVDRDVINAGEQQAEVAALEDGEVAEDDVVAVLQGNGLVADAGLLGLERDDFDDPVATVGKALAMDETGASDGEIVEVLAPEE